MIADAEAKGLIKPGEVSFSFLYDEGTIIYILPYYGFDFHLLKWFRKVVGHSSNWNIATGNLS